MANKRSKKNNVTKLHVVQRWERTARGISNRIQMIRNSLETQTRLRNVILQRLHTARIENGMCPYCGEKEKDSIHRCIDRDSETHSVKGRPV